MSLRWCCLVLVMLITLSCDSDDGVTINEVPEETSAQPCINGMSGEFPCDGIDLLSRIPLSIFEASSGNDSWGWVDSSTGNEYALMGLNNGLAFIDVTTPTQPQVIAKLPTNTLASPWRDVKVYNNHAFIVSEAQDHGMQIFDLTRLREVNNPPQILTADAVYEGFGNAHNIIINEDSGFAYAVGTQTFNGGPHFVNIQNPLRPIAAGGYMMDGYTHDAQVVTYTGPDEDYQGEEILIGSNENEIAIVNISNKDNPVNIATIAYNQIGYTHQGWFTEDQRFFILGDETDERDLGLPTRTLIFDFEDLDNPVSHMNYNGPSSAIDHNGYVLEDEFYLSNYTAGIRILDISGIEETRIEETAFFDTYPVSDDTAFEGVWNVYPYLPSRTIIVSDINRGLFLLRKQ